MFKTRNAGCVLRFKRKRKIANAKIYEDKRVLYCTSDLWSVRKVNLAPRKYEQNCTIASISLFVVQYLCCDGHKARLQYTLHAILDLAQDTSQSRTPPKVTSVRFQHVGKICGKSQNRCPDHSVSQSSKCRGASRSPNERDILAGQGDQWFGEVSKTGDKASI